MPAFWRFPHIPNAASENLTMTKRLPAFHNVRWAAVASYLLPKGQGLLLGVVDGSRHDMDTQDDAAAAGKDSECLAVDQVVFE